MTANAQVVPFNFNSNEVRTVIRDGEPWFVASDVAKALDYVDARHMTRVLDVDEQGLQIVETLGGQQELSVINESGLFHAVLKSRKPNAKPFRKWVTAEVLPAIRKTGRYASPDTLPAPAKPALADVDHPRRCMMFANLFGAGATTVLYDMFIEQDLTTPGNQRFLLYFDRGRPVASPIPDGALLMTPAELADAIAEPGALLLTNAEMIRLAHACLARLAQRTQRAARSPKRSHTA